MMVADDAVVSIQLLVRPLIQVEVHGERFTVERGAHYELSYTYDEDTGQLTATVIIE